MVMKMWMLNVLNCHENKRHKAKYVNGPKIRQHFLYAKYDSPRQAFNAFQNNLLSYFETVPS